MSYDLILCFDSEEKRKEFVSSINEQIQNGENSPVSAFFENNFPVEVVKMPEDCCKHCYFGEKLKDDSPHINEEEICHDNCDECNFHDECIGDKHLGEKEKEIVSDFNKFVANLVKTYGNVKEMAKLYGCSVRTIYRRVKKYGFKLRDFR